MVIQLIILTRIATMEFRPWMIDAASQYIKGSRLLWQNDHFCANGS